MATDPKVFAASHTLEDLAIIMKQMVTDLRNGADIPYARVYWLRKQLSYVVAQLGEGAPSAKDLNAVENHYEKIIGRI